MKPLVLTEEAEAEVTAAVTCYDDVQPGLGTYFVEDLERIFTQIQSDPQIFRLRKRGYRRANLKAFPYFVAFVEKSDSLRILVVAHGHRSPHFWKSRL